MRDVVSPIELPRECIPTPIVEPQINPTAGLHWWPRRPTGNAWLPWSASVWHLGEDRGVGAPAMLDRTGSISSSWPLGSAR